MSTVSKIKSYKRSLSYYLFKKSVNLKKQYHNDRGQPENL